LSDEILSENVKFLRRRLDS